LVNARAKVSVYCAIKVGNSSVAYVNNFLTFLLLIVTINSFLLKFFTIRLYPVLKLDST